MQDFVNLTAFLSPDAGNRLLRAMGELGDSEEVKLERAKAAFNLIAHYGNAGQLPDARALFKDMKYLGDSDEVQELRAFAHEILQQCEGGKPS
jgi:hypothetical protein